MPTRHRPVVIASLEGVPGTVSQSPALQYMRPVCVSPILTKLPRPAWVEPSLALLDVIDHSKMQLNFLAHFFQLPLYCMPIQYFIDNNIHF